MVFYRVSFGGFDWCGWFYLCESCAVIGVEGFVFGGIEGVCEFLGGYSRIGI